MRRTIKRRPKDGAATVLTLLAFNCDERSSAALSIFRYAPNGSVIQSTHLNRFEREFTPDPPGTVGDGLLKFVCSYPVGMDPSELKGLEIEP